MNAHNTAIGRDAPRQDAAAKASGRAVYVDDIQRPGMLDAALLLSPYAHARVTRIDTEAARALPGVRCVLTGADFPHRYGAFVGDEVALAHDVVRYAGEAVAAVAAVDLATARAALALIEVDYDELPSVSTPDEALAPGAPIVHADYEKYHRRYTGPLAPNVCAHMTLSQGDVEAAFAACDVVVEGVYETQAQVHCYLEPCGAVAEVDETGKLVIWSACQSVFRVQATTAEILKLPMSRIRAVMTKVGGAFGGKSDVTVQPIAALLAMRTRRPVKLVLSRDDDFALMRTRHPARIRIRTGAMADGTLVARHIHVVLDGGAYAEDSSAVLGYALLMAQGPYRVPHVRAEGMAVYTNRLRAAGFRGYGNPQVAFAGESQMDELAAKLGLDPLDLRLKNALRTGDTWLGGQRIDAGSLPECLDRLRTATDWANRANRAPTQPGRKRAVGIAALSHICGILSTSAIVRVLEDGTVTLSTGAVDLGEGSDTALAQICAETLQVDVNVVNHATPDTDGSPYNWSTGGSRVTYMVGRAVHQAAAEVRDKLFRHAADVFECATEDLELRPGGQVGLVGVPGRTVSFHALSMRAHWQVGGPIIGNASVMYDGGGIDPKQVVATGNSLGKLGVFIFGAQAVELEVDEETGQVHVLHVWAAHDVGRAINPASVQGQIIGGVAQGLGYALLEDLVFDGPRPANPTLMDYKTPGALDLPPITPIIVEHPEPTGPFGAKGVGEPPIVAIAPAVANAIAAATGTRLRKLPFTPERVLEGLGG